MTVSRVLSGLTGVLSGDRVPARSGVSTAAAARAAKAPAPTPPAWPLTSRSWHLTGRERTDRPRFGDPCSTLGGCLDDGAGNCPYCGAEVVA